MDLESLELFLTIARLGSINKAAVALFLAQSTVTHRLRQLERQTNTVLFERTPSGVLLTLPGKRFIPIATSIVEQIRAFVRESSEQRPLRIVAGKAFASYELPRLLGSFRALHPQFTCYVKSTLYEESITALLAGTADVAFIGNEVYHPQLQQVLLPCDNIVLTVAPTHRWANKFSGFADWGMQEVIAFGNGTAPFRKRIDRFLAENGIYPNVIMELDSISAVKRMVMQNLGVALLPERTLADEQALGSLAVHDIASSNLTRPTLLAYAKQQVNNEQQQQFIEWVHKMY